MRFSCLGHSKFHSKSQLHQLFKSYINISGLDGEFCLLVELQREGSAPSALRIRLVSIIFLYVCRATYLYMNNF